MNFNEVLQHSLKGGMVSSTHQCLLNYLQVFACPLRSDSAKVLKELKSSSHDLVCDYH
jgi:hypothetical protein